MCGQKNCVDGVEYKDLTSVEYAFCFRLRNDRGKRFLQLDVDASIVRDGDRSLSLTRVGAFDNNTSIHS